MGKEEILKLTSIRNKIRKYVDEGDKAMSRWAINDLDTFINDLSNQLTSNTVSKERYELIEIDCADYFQIAICDKECDNVMANMYHCNTKEVQREQANKIIKGLNNIE